MKVLANFEGTMIVQMYERDWKYLAQMAGCNDPSRDYPEEINGEKVMSRVSRILHATEFLQAHLNQLKEDHSHLFPKVDL